MLKSSRDRRIRAICLSRCAAGRPLVRVIIFRSHDRSRRISDRNIAQRHRQIAPIRHSCVYHAACSCNIKFLARALQAFSDPYCQSTCLCLFIRSETEPFRGSCPTRSPILVTSSMTSRGYMASCMYLWRHIRIRRIRKLGSGWTIRADPFIIH